MKKINLWKSSVENGMLVMFSSTYDFITENNLDNILIKKIIIDHLSCMEEQFKKYFLSDLNTEQFIWVQKPFLVEMEQVKHLPLSAQEEFAEFSCNTKLKTEFSKQTLNSFWLSVKAEYPLLSELAMAVLLPFATTYLCEMAFSVMTNIKTKQRSRLCNIEIAMRPALTDIKPRFNLLCQNMQAHPSH
ncbi:protein FAM200A-like [Centruroides sculpturatus]|nr:protein FAM200A-like [Centruroides sculpturatus]